MLVTVDKQTALRLLRIHGINPPAPDDGETAHRDSGIPVTIDGLTSAEFGRCIRLKIAGRRDFRICPVSQFEAETLVGDLQNARADRSLVQLVMKCSKLYEDSGIAEFHLLLHLIPDGYQTHAVYMLRTRNAASRRRLLPLVTR